MISSSSLSTAKKLLDREKPRLALLIGNGVNLVSQGAGGLSWNELMRSLIHAVASQSPDAAKTQKQLNRPLQRSETGQTPASLPEIFDIIEARRNIKSGTREAEKLSLQSMIVERLRQMRPGPPHRALVAWALNSRVPVLTTNYDHCLQNALDSKKWRFGSR